jgi:hypothetical protein
MENEGDKYSACVSKARTITRDAPNILMMEPCLLSERRLRQSFAFSILIIGLSSLIG